MINYLMFVFGEHKYQDKFVELIAEELRMAADTKNIKFYYGETSSIFTFNSRVELKDIEKYLSVCFNDSEIVYFILPFNQGNMLTKLPDGIYNHLFDIESDDTMLGFTLTPQEPNTNKLSGFTDEFIDIFNDYNPYSEILNMTHKISVPTMDEILDKISENGISSLSEYELIILENYSKTI